MIDGVDVLHLAMHASDYMRCLCEGHGVGSLWLPLLMKPKTGDDKQYAMTLSQQYNCNDQVIASHKNNWHSAAGLHSYF